MNTSGKSSSAEKRHRSARVAPRPHLDPSDQPATYDSNEFPVLLRMPDVSRPTAKPDLPAAARQESIQPPPPASSSSVASGATANSSKSRHKRRENGSEPATPTPKHERRWTAAAAGRFWSTIPPQLAAGGMLLAVIALCFVLLRNSDPKPAPANPSDWAGSASDSNEQNLADVSTEHQEKGSPPAMSPTISNSAPQQVNSIANKPQPAEFNEPQKNSQDSVGGWPTSADLGASAATAVDDDVSPIQGWPGAPGAQEASQLFESGTTISAQHTMPTVRTSQRMPSYAESNSSTDTPYLNGTVEIPPPTKIRRQ